MKVTRKGGFVEEAVLCWTKITLAIKLQLTEIYLGGHCYTHHFLNNGNVNSTFGQSPLISVMFFDALKCILVFLAFFLVPARPLKKVIIFCADCIYTPKGIPKKICLESSLFCESSVER